MKRSALVPGLLLAGASLVPAAQLWGGLGIPVVLLTWVLATVIAVKLGARTNRLALRRTSDAGLPVFYGFKARAAFGGEVRVTPAGVVLAKRKSDEPSLNVPWADIEVVHVQRKGPLGPAGLARFLYHNGSEVTLEVDDGARFAQAVRDCDAGVHVEQTGWL